MATKKKKKFIKQAIKRPGALRKATGTPEGKNIPPGEIAAATKKPGRLGQQARFAQNVLIPASKKRKKKKK